MPLIVTLLELVDAVNEFAATEPEALAAVVDGSSKHGGKPCTASSRPYRAADAAEDLLASCLKRRDLCVRPLSSREGARSHPR